MSFEKANFFWHGPSLDLQEYVCVSSFVKNGFDVRVFSYTDLLLPKGASLYDASKILPVSYLSKYTQAGMKGNLAAFSDVFRYQVIKKMGGWWFDTDVLCLAKSDYFAQNLINKANKISLGYQSPDIIACGVLYLDDSHLLNKIIDEVENAGTDFAWGGIGPTLVTRVINAMNLDRFVDPESYYYPIPYTDFRRMYCPEWADWCKSRINGSLAVHLWNEVRRRNLIPSTMMPPQGSFLYDIFITICPELSRMPALPFETTKVLFDYSDLRDEHQKLVHEHNESIVFEKNIKNSFIISSLLTLLNNLNMYKKL